MKFSECTLVEVLLLGCCWSGLFHSAMVPVGGLWSTAVLVAQWLPDFFDHWPAFLQLACGISVCYHALKAFPSSIICSVAGETDLVSVTFFMFLLRILCCVIVLSVGTVYCCVRCLVCCSPCKQFQHQSLLEGVAFQNFCKWNRCGELRNGNFILLLPNNLLPPSSARSWICQNTKADGTVSVHLWDLSF